ncbi:MAG: lysophospholipase [Clostridia bacterium]|nr:lysophospholipase [Clostridia bacterium]MDE7329447.1 lysophospholipase [Clostridia bacterium]
MKKNNKFLGFMIFILYGVLAITIVVPMIATACIVKFAFGRRVNKANKHMTLDEFPEMLTRSVKFKSGKNTLAGYFAVGKSVAPQDYKAVMIIAHGIGCSRASYLNRYDYFARKGYIVFAYDCTGTCESEGKGMRGLVQSQVDLDSAINYVSGIEQLNGYKILVYGHSWGGYAAATELNSKTSEKLTAVATLSGFNDIWGICAYQLTKYATKVVVLTKPWIYIYYMFMYGRRALYTGIKGVSKFHGPVLVMHSKDDPTVHYENSVAIHEDKNKNPQAQFVVFEDKGHTLSRPSEVEKEIKRLHKGKKTQLKMGKTNIFEYNVNTGYEYCDKSLVYATDYDFLDSVNDFFEAALSANV